MTHEETALEMVQEIINGTIGMPSVSPRVAKAIAIIQTNRILDLMYKLNQLEEFNRYQQVKACLLNLELC